MRDIPVAHLHVDPVNPRQEPGDVDELANSIVQVGVLNPLIVRPATGDRYGVLSGSRRLAAADAVGLDVVPCRVVHPADDNEALQIATAENVGRRPMSPIEEARAFRRILDDDQDLTQAELAGRLACSDFHVSVRLQLLELTEDEQQAVHDGTLTVTKAYELLKARRRGDAPIKPRAARRRYGLPDDLAAKVDEAAKIRGTDGGALLERAVRRELARPSCLAWRCVEDTVGGAEARFCRRHLADVNRIRRDIVERLCRLRGVTSDGSNRSGTPYARIVREATAKAVTQVVSGRKPAA